MKRTLCVIMLLLLPCLLPQTSFAQLSTGAVHYTNSFDSQRDIDDFRFISANPEQWKVERHRIIQYPDTQGLSLAMNQAIGYTVGDILASCTIDFINDGFHGFVMRRQSMNDWDNSFFALGVDRESDTAATLKILRYDHGVVEDYRYAEGFTVALDTDYLLIASIVDNALSVTLKDHQGRMIQSLTWSTAEHSRSYGQGYFGFINDGSACRYDSLDVQYTPIEKAKIVSEANWILQTSGRHDGSIASSTDLAQLCPYMSNFAAMGLLRAAQITGNTNYSDTAWDWLTFYYDKMDASGFVTDYNWKDSQWESTGDMDSTDSYAATFLCAYYEAWKVTNDAMKRDTLAPAIDKALDAIQATLDRDGLTWAKPSYKTKYLMDASETYAGLDAAYQLAISIGDDALLSRSQTMRDRLAAGIENLWDSATQTYCCSKSDDDALAPCNWDYFYSDAVSEIWPVVMGVPDAIGNRGASLVSTFDTHYANWDVPTDEILLHDNTTEPVNYWPLVGLAYCRIGDFARALAGAHNLYNTCVSADRAWPYSAQDAGALILLFSGGL